MSKKDEQQMDDLADLVADGSGLDEAAAEMQISDFRAEYLWLRICARLGEQAA